MLAEMFFHDSSQSQFLCRRRIRKLFDTKCIDRFFVETGERNGSSPAHIILDSPGAAVVANLLQSNVKELGWRKEINKSTLPFLQHTIEINQFYIWMLRYARLHGHELGSYMVENLTRYEFEYWGKRYIVNPDAYGQYFIGDDGFHYFLEWDMGTMGVNAFQQKQKRYAAYYASDAYKVHFDTFPLVLVVTTSEERVMNLQKCIGETDRTDINWLFTTQDNAKINPLGKVWADKTGNAQSLC
jgi:DNA-binding Lrp family transcriptional regulator